jgi:hypothetical protein
MLAKEARLNADHIKDRLHAAIHRAPREVSQTELEEVTAIVLAIVLELGAETALILSELVARIEALESAQKG